VAVIWTTQPLFAAPDRRQGTQVYLPFLCGQHVTVVGLGGSRGQARDPWSLPHSARPASQQSWLPLTRTRVATLLLHRVKSGLAGATTSSLPGISVWQGRCLPKVETRFAGTHHATSLSSLACWRPRSRRTSTFQGQLSHHRGASPGSYAPTTCRPPVRPAELRTDDAPVLRWLRLRPRPFAHSIDAPRGARNGHRHLTGILAAKRCYERSRRPGLPGWSPPRVLPATVTATFTKRFFAEITVAGPILGTAVS
jgi:hypothetical protein